MKKERIGAIDGNLVEKTRYFKKLTGISTVELVEMLLSDFFNEIRLTNDYIYIDEIYYFNFKKLIENREVKASKNKIYTDLKESFIVKKIPNNLDEFDKPHNTFCYNGIPEKHLGIYSYNLFISKSTFKDTELLQKYILFDYNEKTEELILKLVDLTDITLIIDLDKNKRVLNDLNKVNEIFIEELKRIKKLPDENKLVYDYNKPLFEFDNPLLYLSSSTVIESYINAKQLSKTIHRTDLKLYNELKGKYNSDDLVIFRNGRLIKNIKDNKLDKTKEIESNKNQN